MGSSVHYISSQYTYRSYKFFFYFDFVLTVILMDDYLFHRDCVYELVRNIDKFKEKLTIFAIDTLYCPLISEWEYHFKIKAKKKLKSNWKTPSFITIKTNEIENKTTREEKQKNVPQKKKNLWNVEILFSNFHCDWNIAYLFCGFFLIFIK